MKSGLMIEDSENIADSKVHTNNSRTWCHTGHI